MLMLGPVLRYAEGTEATVWVETSSPCTVRVLGCEQRTFCVGSHYYALVRVTGLEPGVPTPYEVHLDGERVWPEAGSEWPDPVICTTTPGKPVDIIFGSCRTDYPHEPPYTLRKDEHPEGREVCALRSLAYRIRETPAAQWPGALLHLGDQIYADEVDPRLRELLPGEEIADFHEYTLAYRLSWSEPAIRWLMSSVPSAMIFDDHDVIDDWNTSRVWLEEIRAQDWWEDRIVGAFVSYWIYQHIGNLSPDELAEDELFARVHEVPDAEELLSEFGRRADRDPGVARWSFCRDIGDARLVMVDSRAARVLKPGERKMVDDEEWAYVESCGRTDAKHLLVGTSLPWLLTPGLHHLEAWDEAIAEGAWGKLGQRVGEKLREALDLEHWAAFYASFERFTEWVRTLEGPATIVALSGDVHHAYLAEARFPGGGRSRVYQATASPFRNPLSTKERRVIKFAASQPARWVMRGLARAAGVKPSAVKWRLKEKPIFDNVVAILHVDGARAETALWRARPVDEGHGARLELVHRHAL